MHRARDDGGTGRVYRFGVVFVKNGDARLDHLTLKCVEPTEAEYSSLIGLCPKACAGIGQTTSFRVKE